MPGLVVLSCFKSVACGLIEKKMTSSLRSSWGFINSGLKITIIINQHAFFVGNNRKRTFDG